jgi:hypothetical protein
MYEIQRTILGTATLIEGRFVTVTKYEASMRSFSFQKIQKDNTFSYTHVCAYLLVFLVQNVILSVYTDDVVRWLSAGVAHSVASALADSTEGQYRGAEEIYMLFCLFMKGIECS